MQHRHQINPLTSLYLASYSYSSQWPPMQLAVRKVFSLKYMLPLWSLVCAFSKIGFNLTRNPLFLFLIRTTCLSRVSRFPRSPKTFLTNFGAKQTRGHYGVSLRCFSCQGQNILLHNTRVGSLGCSQHHHSFGMPLQELEPHTWKPLQSLQSRDHL